MCSIYSHVFVPGYIPAFMCCHTSQKCLRVTLLLPAGCHLFHSCFVSPLFKFPTCLPSLYRLPPFAFLSSLRCDVTQGKWVRCNVHMQEACHFPVFGLQEGALYRFRVRAVNKAGEGRPSKATEPILTADPLEHTRTMGKSVAWRPHTCAGYKHITVESLIELFI